MREISTKFYAFKISLKQWLCILKHAQYEREREKSSFLIKRWHDSKYNIES